MFMSINLLFLHRQIFVRFYICLIGQAWSILSLSVFVREGRVFSYLVAGDRFLSAVRSHGLILPE